MIRLILLLILLLLPGCKSQDLPENWRPLTKVVERPLNKIGGDYTTISPYLITTNLDAFNNKNPVELEALRRHEVTHAEEQETYIRSLDNPDSSFLSKRHIRMSQWLHKYVTDKDFRWGVEQRGYKAEMLYLMSRGHTLFPEVYAKILSGKTYMNMVSYEDALEWVHKVIRERR